MGRSRQYSYVRIDELATVLQTILQRQRANEGEIILLGRVE